MRTIWFGTMGLLVAVATAAAGVVLAGSEWRPVRIGDMHLTTDVRAVVQFGGEGRLTGFSGCNRFMGTYEIDGEKIAISPLASTRMACLPPLDALETALFGALQGAATFRRDRVDLTIFGPDGQVLATFAQTDWD